MARCDVRGGVVPLDTNGDLHIAENATQMFDGLQSERLEFRQRADRSLSWFAEGQRAASSGTAITCFASAIEAAAALIAPARCPTCKQDVHGGITRRYNDFLDTYVPDEGLRQQFRRELYSTRSGLSHGARHYAIDAPLFAVDPDEFLDRLKAETATKIAQ